MTRLSMDLKARPRPYKGHKHILVIISEVNSFMVTTTIHKSRPEEIGDASTEHVLCKNSMPEYLVTDQDCAFIFMLINYLFKK